MNAEAEKLFGRWKSTFQQLLEKDSLVVNVQMVHMGCVTAAADYPVCAHCSELAGRLIAAPCPTLQALESSAAGDVVLAGDRYRHFVLNGFTQEQWDEAAARIPVAGEQ